MNIILFDEPATKKKLLPFSYTRPISDIRIGILTIKEKWEKLLPGTYSYLTEDYLSSKFPAEYAEKNLYINACALPNKELIDAIKSLRDNQVLTYQEFPLAFYGKINSPEELNSSQFSKSYEIIEFGHDVVTVQNVYDIFIKNGAAIREDFQLLTSGRKSQVIEDPYTRVYNEQKIFIEENASIKAATLNAEIGPIYIGANAEIGEGSIIRGATSIGEGSVLNLGTRIRGDATIGPFCKVGGEISNSVLFGYSSKAHDGFLGNSVVGEWCNLGADTNTSNLKNDYKDIRIWSYHEERFADTGRQFCGLMMGDQSKCGINTMFNTGTVVGVSSNIFGSGLPRTFIPSFSKGGAHGFSTYQFNEALEVVPKVLERRKKTLTEEDEAILKHIFEVTKKYRQGA